jgi:C1A family cysteine protease
VPAYGWHPDLPDLRDEWFRPVGAALPDEVDLRDELPPVLDQGDLRSCTAHVLAAALSHQLGRQGEPVFAASRLFIYYNERAREGTVGVDAGASLRTGLKALTTYGACPEELWRYDPARFRIRPPDTAYERGRLVRVVRYERIPGDARAVPALAEAVSAGYPVSIGLSVYESFESPEVAGTGVVPLPEAGERVTDGHALLVVGYRDRDGSRAFLCRNSWGPDWGEGGHCRLPATYLDSGLVGYLWLLSQVS